MLRTLQIRLMAVSLRGEYQTFMSGYLVANGLTDGVMLFKVPIDSCRLKVWKLTLVVVDPVKDEPIFLVFVLAGTVVPRPPEEKANPEEDQTAQSGDGELSTM